MTGIGELSWAYKLQRHTSPVSTLFRTQLQSLLKCITHDRQSDPKLDPVLILPLELPNVQIVDTMLLTECLEALAHWNQLKNSNPTKLATLTLTV